MTDKTDMPIGSAVIAYPGVRPDEFPNMKPTVLDTVTRSLPWSVGGQLVVKVEGHAGGIALSHIDVKGD